MYAVDYVCSAESLPFTQVVPGVVVQEGSIRMGSLELDVSEEIAPHLAASCGSDDRGVGDGLARAERKCAFEASGGDAADNAAIGERLLEAKVEIPGHNRRAGD